MGCGASGKRNDAHTIASDSNTAKVTPDSVVPQPSPDLEHVGKREWGSSFLAAASANTLGATPGPASGNDAAVAKPTALKEDAELSKPPALQEATPTGEVQDGAPPRSKLDDLQDVSDASPASPTSAAGRSSVIVLPSATQTAKRMLEESGQTDVEAVSKSMKKDPHLLILYSGGTIGMKSTSAGYAPTKGYLPQRMAELPMLQDPDKPRGTMPKSIYGHHTTYKIKEYDPLLDSSSMNQTDWIRIAEDIKAEYDNYDGFVILHGTDTMAYTASALSFMLENLAKTVVVTGSQIPIAELRNDGVENILGSMLIAGHFQIPEVVLFFRSRVMRGNRTWKESSHSLDGFSSPNLPPLATVSTTIDVDWDNVLPVPVEPLVVHTKCVSEIAVITFFPGISPLLLQAQLAPPVLGAVLQTFGAGNAPENEDLLNVLREASKRGVLLVNVTQCRHGGVSAGAYAAGAGLVKAKVVPSGNITLEAALTKMSVVLGRGLSIDAAREAMAMNLAGEMDDKRDDKLLSLSSTAFIRAVGKALGTFGQESRAHIQKVLLPVMACSAAGAGDVAELAGIFRVGESPDCCDYDNRAPLHIAAAEGHVNCVTFLIEQKADVNIADRWGGVPLDDACLHQHTEVCELLLSNGATSSKLTEKLFNVVHDGNIEQAKLMVRCRADVNSVDYDGRSVLMLAARTTVDLVQLVLDARADPSKQDAWGHTALEDAKDPNIKMLLEEIVQQSILDSVGQ